MRFNATLWKANIIAFISSFCVMVIELVAARLLAPYIGVSLYTWTSVIGVILTGIALGNYLGGRIADRYGSPIVLSAVFFLGGLFTIGILPAIKLFGPAAWLGNLPLMLNLAIKIALIFFLPALVLSIVSPVVIKLTLADLGQTGGVVGTIYAFSTAGSILGTFLTGFFFVMWFGARMIVWLDSGVLFLAGIIAWFSWKVPDRWKLTPKNSGLWVIIGLVLLGSLVAFQFRVKWEEHFTAESNYYSIRVLPEGNVRVLVLDRLVHSYVIPNDPIYLRYDYLNIFRQVVDYITRDNPAPHILHLGGGGYSFPRYMETVYPASVNDVVEIDPVVTRVAYQELGLSPTTKVKTYNEDARLFLMQTRNKYDVVIGDVFNDFSTPYHLTTLEFDLLVKGSLKEGGIYLLNVIDDFQTGRYMPSIVYTLKQAFRYVYLFGTSPQFGYRGNSTFVILATDRAIDLGDYGQYVSKDGTVYGYPYEEAKLDAYLAERDALLLTDDHAPTDILIAPLIKSR